MKNSQVFLRERSFSYVSAALIILLMGFVSAHAATMNVTPNATDTLNGADGQCSLREAITNINDGANTYADCANTGCPYGTNDTINIPVGTYTLSRLNPSGVPEDANVTGDLDITADVTISGAGADTTIIHGGGIDRVLHIENLTSSITVTVSDVTIRGGDSAGSIGGGILMGNEPGTLILNRSTVSGNSAGSGSLAQGGGIWKVGTVILNSSTVSGNSAFAGGGIMNYQGTLNLNNSTVSGNSAGYGGGIIHANHGPATTLNNCTVSGNIAPSGNGRGLSLIEGTVTLKNTILDNGGNPGTGNCDFGCSLNANLISLGYNLSTDVSCQSCVNGGSIFNGNGGLNSSDDLYNTPAYLAPLGNYGGPTQTHALCTVANAPHSSCVADSPAIDHVPATDCNDNTGTPVPTDQRCAPRPFDGDTVPGANCDIGAYEYGSTVPTPTTCVADNPGYCICEPLPDGSACTQFCPTPGLSCQSTERTFDPATMQWTVTKCECLDVDACYVGILTNFPPDPPEAYCEGTACPQGRPCELTAIENNDGTITYDCCHPCEPPPSGMVAWWTLDEPNGSTAINDIAGYNSQGIPRPGGQLGVPNGPNAVTGKVGGALDVINPAAQFVEVPDQGDLNFGTTTDFAIDAWFNMRSSQACGGNDVKPIVDKRDPTGANPLGYMFYVSGHDLRLDIANIGYTTAPLCPVPFGEWCHLAVTVDRAGGVIFYVNGAPFVPLGPSPAGLSAASPLLTLLIGGTHNPSLPLGKTYTLDELEIFDTVLAPTKILDIYQAGSAGKCKCEPLPDNSGCTTSCPGPTDVCRGQSVQIILGQAPDTPFPFVTECTCDPSCGPVSIKNDPGTTEYALSCFGDCPGPTQCQVFVNGVPQGEDTVFTPDLTAGDIVTCDCPGCETEADCDDGDNCTIDVCSNGLCQHAVIDPCCPPLGPCPCSSHDQCFFGWCCNLSTGFCEPPPPSGSCPCSSDDECGSVLCCNEDTGFCQPLPCVIPTVSEWGLAVLTLLLLTGGKIYFGRRETATV